MKLVADYDLYVQAPSGPIVGASEMYGGAGEYDEGNEYIEVSVEEPGEYLIYVHVNPSIGQVSDTPYRIVAWMDGTSGGSAGPVSVEACTTTGEARDMDRWSQTKELEDETILRACALSSDSSVLQGVARNWLTPQETLTILASHADKLVRSEVAHNARTPKDTLRRLLQDKETAVRQDLATNRSLPDDVLNSLIQVALTSDGLPLDDRDYIARGVALNPKTPADVLSRLATNSWYPVRLNVATNRSSPDDLIRILAGDREERVRVQALANLKRRNLEP
jgi:hypothetical protein